MNVFDFFSNIPTCVCKDLSSSRSGGQTVPATMKEPSKTAALSKSPSFIIIATRTSGCNFLTHQTTDEFLYEVAV